MKTLLKLASLPFSALLLAGVGGLIGNADAACIGAGVVDNLNDCVAVDKGGKDCLLAFSIDGDGLGNPPLDPKKGTPTTKIECEDGAACDRDGHVNGRCTFHLGMCINVGSCSGSLSNLTVKKPSEKDSANAIKKEAAYSQRLLLVDGLGTMLPDTAELCTESDLEFVVHLASKGGVCASPAGQKCSNDQDCDDYCVLTYKKGKGKVKAQVDDGDKQKDADALKFTCLPGTPGSTSGAEGLQVADAADLIGGPLAMGRTGDWLLRNSDVRVVVRDAGRMHSFMVTEGGHIIDADLVRDDPSEDRDNFQGMQALINLEATQATTAVSVLNDGSDGNPAIIRTSGPDDLFDVLTPNLAIFQAGSTLTVGPDTIDNDLPLALQTDYILRADSNYVQVATTVENLGGTDLRLPMGDYLNGGGAVEMFAPGLGFGESLLRLGGDGKSVAPQGLDFIAYQGGGAGLGVTYGIVFPRSIATVGINKFRDGTFLTGAFVQTGVAAWIHRQNLVGYLNGPFLGKPEAPFEVLAGGTNTLRRWFVVGETVADVTRAREELFGNALGAIQGTVTSNGQPVANAHVALTKFPGNRCGFAGSSNCINVYSATLTDENGFYRAYVVPDTYDVQVRAHGIPYEGSASQPTSHPVTVKKKKTAVVDIDFPQSSAIQVNVVDHNGAPLAAKISIVGFEASPDPRNLDSVAGLIENHGRYFGTPFEEKDADIFGVASTIYAGISGSSPTTELEPGSYHVVVSHGAEYDVYDEAVTLVGGATTVVNATVNRVVDTGGFVSIDTHVHMINSPDSAVSRERRLLTMLAEGVDFFANTDHDFVHDLGDEVADMGASALIKTAPGNELTTFSYGHFNTWPLAVDPASPIGGAVDWGRAGTVPGQGYPSLGSYDLLPSEILAHFDPATQVIQINHVKSHFADLGIDTQVAPPASSSLVYACTAGWRIGLPCAPEICRGGANDGLDCADDTECPDGVCNVQGLGRDCPADGGVCAPSPDNLSAFLRLDPTVSNLYSDDYTALEVWIEGGRGQTETFLHENLGDWIGLLNQGLFKTGIADSDTHQAAVLPAGSPRTYVASATDLPGDIDPALLALNVNAGRAVGANGLFMLVNLVGDAAATASHGLADPLTVAATGGSGTIELHVESPTWAEFDSVDVYMNTVPDCETALSYLGVAERKCDAVPAATFTAGVDFTVNTTVGVSGAGQRLEADLSIPVTVSEDTWIIVVVRGTDGVSRPLFPVNPAELEHDSFTNVSLGQLTDSGVSPPWNLGEGGIMATAFSNPLFFDFENDGLCHGGSPCP